MKTNYAKNCAICNCFHTNKIFFQGSWHSWVAPSKEQIESRKQQRRGRRKYPY